MTSNQPLNHTMQFPEQWNRIENSPSFIGQEDEPVHEHKAIISAWFTVSSRGHTASECEELPPDPGLLTPDPDFSTFQWSIDRMVIKGLLL